MEVEASNGSSLKRRSIAANEDEDTNISIFRRRNKIIAVIFMLLIISLTLFIAALLVHLLRNPDRSVGTGIPPIVYFCVFSNAPTCATTLNPIITNKFITDPNQIFALSLQTAAKHVQTLINTSSTADASNFAINNCSNSLRDGLGRIRESLATIRVNPFVELLSKEERIQMKDRIVAAEEDVESCLDDSAKFEPPEMTAKLVEVQVYLISAADFIGGYAKMGRLHIVELDRSIVSENMFGIICMCGLQLLFMFGLFCSLFRVR